MVPFQKAGGAQVSLNNWKKVGCGRITHWRRNTNVNWNGFVLCKVNRVACTNYTPTFFILCIYFFWRRTRADCTRSEKYVNNCRTLAYSCFQSQNNKTFQRSTSIQVAVQPYFCCFRIFLKPCTTFDIFRRFLSQTAKANAYKLHSTFSIW